MGKPFIVAIHCWMRSHRVLGFSLVLLCWAAFAFLAARMQPDSSSLAFFPDDAPQLRRMAKALDVSPASGLLFIDLSTEHHGGKYALASAADAIMADMPKAMAERVGAVGMPDAQALMALLPYFTDEATLAQLQIAAADAQIDTSVRVARDNLNSLLAAGPAQEWLRADPLGLRQHVLSRLPAEHAGAMPDPVLGYPVSADGKHLLLVLRPAHSLHDVNAAARLMDAIHASMQQHLTPDMQGLVVGGHRHSAVNAQVIQRDVTNIVFFSMLGFVLVYALLVRSRGVLWLMLVPAFAASFALGGMTLLSPVLSGLALGFGASVLGVAEDYAVHMHFALRSGQSTETVLEHITPPLFQGYLVNASGFAVLLLSGIPAVRQLALFALLTLSAGFALAVIVLPVCPWFNTPPLPVHKQNTVPRQPAPLRVFTCVFGLLLLCYALFSIVRVDVSPRTMGAGMAQLQQDGEKLKAVWGSRDSNILVVEGKTTAEALANGRAVADALRRLEPENKVGTLTDVWPSQEQAQASRRQQTFNGIMTVLGVIGDAIQLAISGTTGIGSLAGSLLNTGYNIVSGTRAYEADRADIAWNQQMQEKQRQDSLTQQRYENEASERAYQDALKQQAFNNSVTSEKLNIAKGEWALKQSNAQAKASRAAGNAAAKSSGSGKASGSAAGTTGGTAGTNALKGSSVVPFTAALLRSRGKSDTSIANALQKEGYTTSEIAKILQQMNQ